MIDCCWGAGVLSDECVFVPKFSEDYFCVPPSRFIFTHWPTKEGEQFLNPPLTGIDTFERLPAVKSKFFANEVSLLEPKSAVIQVSSEGEATVILTVPRDVHVKPWVSYGRINRDSHFIHEELGDDRVKIVISIRCLDQREGLVSIGFKKGQQANFFEVGLQFSLLNPNLISCPEFPVLYTPYTEGQISIFEPLILLLQQNKTYSFRAQTSRDDPAELVVFHDLNNIHKMKRNSKGEWAQNVVVNKAGLWYLSLLSGDRFVHIAKYNVL